MQLSVERGRIDTDSMWGMLNASPTPFYVFLYYSTDLALFFIQTAMQFYLDPRQAGYQRADPKYIPSIIKVIEVLGTYDAITLDTETSSPPPGLEDREEGLFVQCQLASGDVCLYQIEEWWAPPDADAPTHGYAFYNLDDPVRVRAFSLSLARILDLMPRAMQEKILAALPGNYPSVEALRQAGR